MVSETSDAAKQAERLSGSTQRREAARATITKTTITPAPGHEPVSAPEVEKTPWRERLRSPHHGELLATQEPYPGTNVIRFVMASLLSVLCLLTVGGAILMLLLWQQERASGVLTSQLERTWDLFDLLRQIERYVAFVTIPVAVAWIALAVTNVRRGTGQRRNPVVAALSLVVGVAGVWVIGDQIVGQADDWLGQLAGYVLQLVFLAVPLLALERVATSAEARHRPLRAAFLISAVFLAHMQFLAGLSTVDQTIGSDEWGRVGAYLIIAALMQVLGALAVNEAARAIEDGLDNRYRLRARFGESLLSQAARG